MDLAASLSLIAPEIVLSVSGLILLLVAAWVGDKASSAISIAAAVVLGACFFIVAPSVCAGVRGPDTVAFGGQCRAEAFAGFAKILIYAAAGASLVITPKFFDGFRAMRGDYPILILFAVLGMSIMVSATELLTLYIGLELNSLAAYVLA